MSPPSRRPRAGMAWALGALSGLLGLGLLTEAFIAAVLLIAAAAILLPPVRRRAYVRTGRAMALRNRVSLVMVFWFGASLAWALHEEREILRVELEVERAAARQHDAFMDSLRTHFRANRDELLREADSRLRDGDYEAALDLLIDYSFIGDTAVSRLQREARATRRARGDTLVLRQP